MKPLYAKFFNSEPLGAAGQVEGDATPDANPDLPKRLITLFIQTQVGKTITVHLKSEIMMSMTVVQLKNVIESIEGIPEDQQRLVHAGTLLDNPDTLVNHGIQDNSTLHLVLRLLGC